MPILSNLAHGIADQAAALGGKLGLGGGAAAADGPMSNYEFREFYAAACGHCKHLAPIWDSASRSHTAQHGGNVKWTQIECADEGWNPVAENQEACKEIQGFPTMKMFKDGKEIGEYMGARNEKAIIDWVNNQAGIKAACMPMDLAIVMGMKPETEVEEKKTMKADFL